METIQRYEDGTLAIRQTTEADTERMWELAFREESPEWKKWDAPYYAYEALTYEKFLEQKKAQMIGNKARWVIEVDGELIGMISYYWEHEESLWLEMGIVIFHPNYWSGGYGTRALRLWINHLFQTMPLVRVGYTTWSGNERMIQVGYKLGMTMEARLRKCRLYQGVYYDSIRMGMLREEWEQHKQAERQ